MQLSTMPVVSIARASRRAGPAAALNLTPRALGWDRIHFAVRHLAAGAVWTGLSRDQERCLVLLRGEFEVELGRRVAPRRPARRRVSGYPHAVYLPAGRRSGSSRAAACEIADCRASRVDAAAAGAARHPARGLRLRDPRRRQRDPADRRHRAAGVSGGPAAALRGVHAGRQLVVVSAAQARHRRSAARGRSRGGLLLPLPRIRTDTASSASIPSGATTRCGSRTATSSRCATAITRLLQPMATMPTT